MCLSISLSFLLCFPSRKKKNGAARRSATARPKAAKKKARGNPLYSLSSYSLSGGGCSFRPLRLRVDSTIELAWLPGWSGSIVITSSIGGEKGFALESLYCMTKGAVLQLARSIAVEYRDEGIRANAVCPGFVKTAHGLREIDELDGLGQSWSESSLAAVQGRLCEPEEVAAAALWLCSDEASFVNGTALYVDNGWYAKG